MPKMTRKQYAQRMLELNPYAIASMDSGHQIHMIDRECYFGTDILITFENDCYMRKLHDSPKGEFFILNNKRFYLDDFYKV